VGAAKVKTRPFTVVAQPYNQTCHVLKEMVRGAEGPRV